MQVSTTFAFTDSPTPRKLISAEASRMNDRGDAQVGSSTNCRR